LVEWSTALRWETQLTRAGPNEPPLFRLLAKSGGAGRIIRELQQWIQSKNALVGKTFDPRHWFSLTVVQDIDADTAMRLFERIWTSWIKFQQLRGAARVSDRGIRRGERITRAWAWIAGRAPRADHGSLLLIHPSIVTDRGLRLAAQHRRCLSRDLIRGREEFFDWRGSRESG